MGGYSSGRKSQVSCTDDHLSIDARQWQRNGVLVAGTSFNTTWSRADKEIGNIGVKTEGGHVRLSYSWQKNGGESIRLDYPVSLQATSCHYGGVRYWFTCPAIGCGKRVAKLYLGEKYFACRHCYKLAYSSQRETTGDRGHRGANKIRRRLGWPVGIINPASGKPKGMHWKTYYRLYAVHNEYANQVMKQMMATLKIVDKRFSALEKKMNYEL